MAHQHRYRRRWTPDRRERGYLVITTPQGPMTFDLLEYDESDLDKTYCGPEESPAVETRLEVNRDTGERFAYRKLADGREELVFSGKLKINRLGK